MFPFRLVWGGMPVQPPGNHQMKNQPEIALELDGNSFADPSQTDNFPVAGLCQGRKGGAQEERRREPDLEQFLAQQSPLERFEVNRNIRQFWHSRTVSCSGLLFTLGGARTAVSAPRRNLPQAATWMSR